MNLQRMKQLAGILTEGVMAVPGVGGQVDEKSSSEKQARFMAAAAHDPKFAKKAGMDRSVAKEFNKADTGTKQLSNAMKHKTNETIAPDNEANMQTAGTVGRNQADAAFDAAQVEEGSTGNFGGYDCELTISNPFVERSEDEPDDITIGVNYKISGSYSPATREEPAEEPDLDITYICRLDTGEELNNLPDETMRYIEEQVWDYANSGEHDMYETDAQPFDDDDYDGEGEGEPYSNRRYEPLPHPGDGDMDEGMNYSHQPSEAEIKDVMRQTGMEYNQAVRHLQQRHDLVAQMSRQKHKASMGSNMNEFDEAFDMNNGYADIDCADSNDFFPNGADSPVVRKVGPSGARQGDNPEQKKMQVAEVHKELVYGYRNYLNESKKLK
jgi:hypothetical protein